MKFKVGDKVRLTNIGITTKWGKVGDFGEITSVYQSRYAVYFKHYKRFGYCSEDQLEPVETSIPRREIHITTDGFVTHAVMKEDGKVIHRAEARCSPADKYDFSVGAKLALERLGTTWNNLEQLGTLPKKTTPKEIKVGDKVRVRSDLVIDEQYGTDAFVHDMDKMRGKTVTIAQVRDDDTFLIVGNAWNWTREMFEVAE